MKSAKKKVACLAKTLAEITLRRDANITTCAHIYQPKVPAGLKHFKKDRQ